MKIKSSLVIVFCVLVAVLALAFTAVSALAAPESHELQTIQVQEDSQVASVAELSPEFLFFLVTVTGFIKARFGLKGNNVLLLGFVVGLFLYFYPLLIPTVGPVISNIVEFLKWFIGAAGAFDTAVDAGSKIIQQGDGSASIKGDL